MKAPSASGSACAFEDVRPLGVGELLDAVGELLRTHPLACLASAIGFWLPARALEMFYIGPPSTSDPQLATAQALAQISIAYAVTTMTTALVSLVGESDWLGRPLRPASAALRLALGLPMVVLANLLGLLLILPGLMACLLPGIYTMWRLLFAPLVVVVEGRGPLAALGRSWLLTRTGFSRWLVAIFFMTALTAPMSLLASTFDSGSAEAWLRDWLPTLSASGIDVLSWVGSAILLGVPGALGGALISVLYLDQRVRLEGRDLELRLKELEARSARRTREAGSSSSSPSAGESAGLA